MKIYRKIMNYGFLAIGAVALIGLIIGTFLDQQITAALGNVNSLFGILFTLLAPVISLGIGTLAGSILFFMPKLENKKLDIFLRALGAAAFIVLSAFSIKEGIAYVDFPRMQAEKTTFKVLVIVLVVLIDIGIIFFTKVAIKDMDVKRIIPVILTIFVILAAWLFVSEIIKYLASRPRPRNVFPEHFNLTTEAIAFRNWYEFRPLLCLKEEFKDCKSFVSGHTFIAACLIGIIPLIHSLNAKKASPKMAIAGLAVGSGLSIIVAFSRIVAEAHYMSDVMGAILFSVVAQALILNIAYKLLEKRQTNKE